MTDRVAQRIIKCMLLPWVGVCLLSVLAFAPSLHLMGHIHEATSALGSDSACEHSSVPNNSAAPDHDVPKGTKTSTCVTCLLLTVSKAPPPVLGAVERFSVSPENLDRGMVPDWAPYAILHGSAGPRAPPALS